MTHYIDAGEFERSAAYNPSGQPSRYLSAVCGVTIRSQAHDPEPTCLACRAALVAQAADEVRLLEALGCEEVRPGVWGRKEEEHT